MISLPPSIHPFADVGYRRPLGISLWFCAVFLLSGCALQADVMELGTNMEEVEGLQRKLETQLEDAEEAIESVRAMKVRMETVEEKLAEGVSPELEARINVGLKTLEHSQRQLAAERPRTARRLKEAETFFIDQVKQVSARQRHSEDSVAAMESRLGAALASQSGTAKPGGVAAAAAPEDDPYLQWLDSRLSDVSNQLRELRRAQEEATQEVTETPEETVRLDPRVEELSLSLKALETKIDELATTPAVQPVGEALEQRLAALEVGASDGASQAVQQRMDQIAQATDMRLEQMAKQQSGQAQPLVEVLQHQARQDQILTLLDQRMSELSAATAGTTGPTAAHMVQLAQRVDVMEAATQKSLNDMRLALGNRAGGPRAVGETAALAGLSGQMELLAASLDERIGRLEAANTSAPRAVPQDGASSDRIDALEPQLQRLDSRVLAAEQAQMADMATLREQVAKLAAQSARQPPPGASGVDADSEARMARQEQTLMSLERRLAAQQTDPQVAFLTERLETLADRFDGLEKQPAAAQDNKRGVDAAGLASVSAQLSLLEASLNQRIDALNRQMENQADNVASSSPAPDSGLAKRLDRQEQILSRLGQQLTALQADPKGAFIEDQVGALSTELRQGLKALNAKISDSQQSTPAPSGPDPAAMAGLSGQVALLEANMAGRIARLEKSIKGQQASVREKDTDTASGIAGLVARFDRLGERIDGLEQAQLKEISDLRQQVKALSKNLSQRSDAPAP